MLTTAHLSFVLACRVAGLGTPCRVLCVVWPAPLPRPDLCVCRQLDKIEGVFERPSDEVIRELSRALRQALGVSLFGIDIIINNQTGQHAVIDINAFPGELQPGAVPARLLGFQPQSLGSGRGASWWGLRSPLAWGLQSLEHRQGGCPGRRRGRKIHVWVPGRQQAQAARHPLMTCAVGCTAGLDRLYQSSPGTCRTYRAEKTLRGAQPSTVHMQGS